MSEAIRIARTVAQATPDDREAIRTASRRQHEVLRGHRDAVLARCGYLLTWVVSLTVPVDYRNDEIEDGLRRRVNRILELVGGVVAYATRGKWAEAETRYRDVEAVAVNLDNWGRLYWSEAHVAAETAARRRGHAAKRDHGATVAELYVAKAKAMRVRAPALKRRRIVVHLENHPPDPPHGWDPRRVKRDRRSIARYLLAAGLRDVDPT